MFTNDHELIEYIKKNFSIKLELGQESVTSLTVSLLFTETDMGGTRQVVIAQDTVSLARFISIF